MRFPGALDRYKVRCVENWDLCSSGRFLAGQRPRQPLTGPALLDFGLLSHLQCVINLDAKVPDSAF